MSENTPMSIEEPSKLKPLYKRVTLWIGIGILGLLLLAGISMFTTQPPQPANAQDNQDKQKGWVTLSTAAFTHLAVDPQGKVWGLSPDKGIATFNSAKDIEWIALDENLKGISALRLDSKGNVWVGTGDGVVGMRDSNGKWKIFTPDETNGCAYLADMVLDAQDRVWTNGDGCGMGMIDPVSATAATYTSSSSGLNGGVTAIAVDQQGSVWRINQVGQLQVLEDGGSWGNRATLPGKDLSWLHLAIDQQGLPWVSTTDKIYHLGADNQWFTYRLGQGVMAPISIGGIDHLGRLWVTSAANGVYMFEASDGWTTFNGNNSGLKDGWVYAIAVDSENKIWIATRSELSQFDASSTSIRSSQKAEQNYILLTTIHKLSYGLIVISLLGIILSVDKVRKLPSMIISKARTMPSAIPFLLSFPPVQALFTYLVCVYVIRFLPIEGSGLRIIDVLTAFSILSPILNLFARRWWLNTGLFLLSWYLLLGAIISLMEARSGQSLGAGAIGFIIPMLAVMFSLPVTALIKLIMFIVKKRVNT